jgi:hypothetical protein
MRRLLFATAALALIGGVGSANAVTMPINTLTNVVIWSAPTPGAVQTDPSQLALPNMINPIMTSTNLQASGAATGMINFNLPGPFPGATSMIQDFLTTDTGGWPSGNPCQPGSACGMHTLSVGLPSGPSFSAVTLFDFTFTAPTGPAGTTESLTTTHDDGASLFLAGTESSCTGDTTALCMTDLFPVADASPTFAELSGPAPLTPGDTYDIWYLSANGDPEQLTSLLTVNSPVMPDEPSALLLFGAALVGLGLFVNRNRLFGLRSTAAL